MAIIEKVWISVEAVDNMEPWLNKVRDDIKGFQDRIKSDTAIKLSLNVAQLDQKLKNLRAQIKEAQKSWDFELAVKLKADEERLKQQLTSARRELRNFVRTWDKDVSVLWKLFAGVSWEIEKSREELIKLWKSTKWLDKLAEQAKQLEEEFKKWKINAQEYAKSLNKIAEQAKKSNTNLWWLANKLWTIVKWFIAYKWIQLIREWFESATQTAIDFESAFTWVRKTINATEPEFKKIKRDLIWLSEQIPLSFETLSHIAELWWQLGVAQKDIIDFTKTIWEISVSTNLTSEEAATDFARIANIMDEPISKVNNMASSVVALGNNFAAQEDEIVNLWKRIGWVWHIVWLTTWEIFGISTAFTSVWIEAEAWWTAIQNVLLKLNKAVVEWWKDLQKFASFSWKTKEQFVEDWNNNPAKTFEEFIKDLWTSWKKWTLILQDLVWKDSRLQRAFLSLAQNSKILTDAINMWNKAYKENIALSNEANQRFKTTESQLKILNNQYKAQSEELWLKLIPLKIKLAQLETAGLNLITTTENEKVKALRKTRQEIIEQIQQLETLDIKQKTWWAEAVKTFDTVNNESWKFTNFMTKAVNIVGWKWLWMNKIMISSQSDVDRALKYTKEELKNVDLQLNKLWVATNISKWWFNNLWFSIFWININLQKLRWEINRTIYKFGDFVNIFSKSWISWVAKALFGNLWNVWKKIQSMTKKQKDYNDVIAKNPQLTQIIKIQNELDVLNTKIANAKKNWDLWWQVSATLEFDKLNKKLSELSKNYYKIWKTATTTYNKINKQAKKQISLEEKQHQAMIKWTIKETIAYTKEMEKRKKEYNRYLKNKEDFLKKAYQTVSKVLDKEASKVKETISKYDDQIKSLKQWIKSINDSLKDLEKWKTTDLSSRYVAIEKQLAEINKQKKKDLKQINKLLKEKALIEKNVDKKTLNQAVSFDKLSPTEKILKEYETRKKQYEQEKAIKLKEIKDLQKQKEQEKTILAWFNAKKAELDQKYKELKISIEKEITDVVIKESNKQIDKLEELRQKAIAAAKAMKTAWIVWQTANSNTTNHNNIKVEIKEANNPKLVAKQVQDTIVKTYKNVWKGSF